MLVRNLEKIQWCKGNRNDRGWESQGYKNAVLYTEIKQGFFEKVSFEQRPKVTLGSLPCVICEKSISGKERA